MVGRQKPSPEKLRFLILEDSPVDAELIEDVLKQAGLAFIFKRVETEEAYLEALKTFSPDLILSDYDLPRYNGFLALKLAKQQHTGVPFILVTGALGEIRAIDILTSGATDYVLKNRLARLVPAVKRALSEAEERKARRHAEEELRKSTEEIYNLYNHAPCGYHSLAADGTFLRMNDTELSWLGYTRDEVIGKMRFPDVLTPDSLKLFSRNFPDFKERGWARDLEYVFLRKDGTTMPVLLSAAAVRGNDGNYLMSRTTVYDMTESKRAEDQAARLNRLYSVLSKVNDAILHIRDLDALYPAICRIAVEEGMFRMAWVGFVDGNNAVIKPVAWHGVEDGYLQDVKISMDKTDEGLGPTGTAVREGAFNISNDWDNDPRMNPWKEEGRKRGYRSSGAFPLRKGNRTIGALTLYAGIPHFFTGDQVSLLESMADNLSFAIQMGEQEKFRKEAEEKLSAAHRKLREMTSEMIRTEERERQHIATVLHDTVAQTLAAAKMKCESVREYLAPDGLQPMADARDLVAQSIQQTRSIMAELSPPILYELGFLPALEWLTGQFTDQHGIPVEFKCVNGPLRLQHDVQVLLYQATRELLTNVVKHAKAQRATVGVSETKGRVKVEVVDDGVGIDKAKMGYYGDLSGGFGLFSIRERLKHFDGQLDIHSGPGKGTRVVMSVPALP